jgi:hypothetical protein
LNSKAPLNNNYIHNNNKSPSARRAFVLWAYQAFPLPEDMIKNVQKEKKGGLTPSAEKA